MDLALNNLQRLICHKTQPTDHEIDRIYVSSKEGSKGLIRIENCEIASMQELEDSTKRAKKDWLQSSETAIWMEFRIERKATNKNQEKCEEKQLYR